MKPSLRVVVAVGDPVMTAGIEAALTADGANVLACAGPDADAARLSRGHRPEVCVLDGDQASAVADAAAVRRASPGTAVLLLGSCEDVATLRSALAAGACGYLSKDVRLERLSAVLTAAAAGQAVIARHLVEQLVPPYAGARGAPVPQQRRQVLTERESQVLALLEEGYSTAAIASRLYVAPVTVRTHVAAVARKLGVRGRASLRGGAVSG